VFDYLGAAAAATGTEEIEEIVGFATYKVFG